MNGHVGMDAVIMVIMKSDGCCTLTNWLFRTPHFQSGWTVFAIESRSGSVWTDSQPFTSIQYVM